MEGNGPNFNQPNSLYSYPNQNPNYMPTQINIGPQNSEGYNSQDNNFYSGYSSQMGANIYSQSSGNIYSQPQNTTPIQSNPPLYAPQTSRNINQEYDPQISGEINLAYAPKTNGEIALSPVNISPISDDTANIPTSTESLVPTSNVVVVKSSCCETDEAIEELSCCCKFGVIGSCVALAIIGFNDMVFTSRTKHINYALFLVPDLLYLFFSIFEPITIIRIRWLRTTGGILSIVYLVISIVFGILQLINLNNHKNEEGNVGDDGHDFIDDCIPFTYLRVIAFIIILNIIFYAYWRIKICFRCKNNGTSYYDYEYDSGDTHITTTSSSYHHHPHHQSAPHHHSAPHHSAPFRSAPHHSTPHHSAPHHSAPHHSAPHHAPHHSAPHHSAHHAPHHGGHRRH